MSHTAPTTWTERRLSALSHCQAVSADVEASERPNAKARLMVEHAFVALAKEPYATSPNERALLLMQARAYAGSALIILGRLTVV